MGNRRLQAEMDDLRGRFNISIDQMTADEIAGLVSCCRRIDNPYEAAGLSLSDLPAATVRGVGFYPLTVGASIWLDEYAARWWGDDDRCYFWALVFAVVHAHERDTFAKLTERHSARAAILCECMRFAFTRREVERAVDLALGRGDDIYAADKTPADDNAHADWVSFLARLETQTGIRKDEWLWGRSAAYTVKAYQDLHRFASSFSANGSKVRIFDEMDKALNALARLKKAIKDRIEMEAHGDER